MSTNGKTRTHCSRLRTEDSFTSKDLTKLKGMSPASFFILGILALAPVAWGGLMDNVVDIFSEEADATPEDDVPAFAQRRLTAFEAYWRKIMHQAMGIEDMDAHNEHQPRVDDDDAHMYEGVIETEDKVNGVDDGLLTYPGAPLPVPKGEVDLSEEAVCPCRSILVSSLGPAQHYQTGSVGVYAYYQMYNGRPAYHSGNNRLYYLNGSGWLIGPVLGGTLATIHNADSANACPYLIVSPMWMYVWNSAWNYDNTLVVRCIA